MIIIVEPQYIDKYSSCKLVQKLNKQTSQTLKAGWAIYLFTEHLRPEET